MITIQGGKYSFGIFSEKEEQDCCFFVRAIAKPSRKSSCINNLNAMLSEFGIDIEDPRFADSQWVVSKEKAQQFSDIATEALSNRSFLEYIERQLDEDRSLGEWENVS